MKLDARIRDNTLTVYVAGELDHHAARAVMGAIEEQIDRFLPKVCVIDMAGLTFMDSSGVAVILKTSRRMKEISGRVETEHVPPQAARVLEAAGVSRLVRVRGLHHALKTGGNT